MKIDLLFSFPGGNEWFVALFGIGLALFCLGFWITMIVEIASSQFTHKDMKIVWLLITIFMGLFGAFIYYIAGRSTRIANNV